MAPVLTMIVSDDVYVRKLHVLGASWCLGSSAVEPELLLRYLPARPQGPRAAAL